MRAAESKIKKKPVQKGTSLEARASEADLGARAWKRPLRYRWSRFWTYMLFLWARLRSYRWSVRFRFRGFWWTTWRLSAGRARLGTEWQRGLDWFATARWRLRQILSRKLIFLGKFVSGCFRSSLSWWTINKLAHTPFRLSISHWHTTSTSRSWCIWVVCTTFHAYLYQWSLRSFCTRWNLSTLYRGHCKF